MLQSFHALNLNILYSFCNIYTYLYSHTYIHNIYIYDICSFLILFVHGIAYLYSCISHCIHVLAVFIYLLYLLLYACESVCHLATAMENAI